MKDGKETSEYKMGIAVMIAATVISVLSSMGKVPFTPDQAMAYFVDIGRASGEWAKPLMTLYGTVFALYGAMRTYLKKSEK